MVGSEFGVPHGSFLGTVLFLLYVNELNRVVKICFLIIPLYFISVMGTDSTKQVYATIRC